MHRQDHLARLLMAGNGNRAAAGLELQAVIDRILHERLQNQLRHHDVVQFLRNFDLVTQLALITCFLDIQIVLHMLLLVTDCDEIPPLREADAEHARQCIHQLDHVVGLMAAGHPADGIKRII